MNVVFTRATQLFTFHYIGDRTSV